MYTVKQVAELLKVSEGLLYADIRAGRLASHCFGRKTLRISSEDLSAYLAASKGPTAGTPQRKTSARQQQSSATTFKHLNANKLAQAWTKPSQQRA